MFEIRNSFKEENLEQNLKRILNCVKNLSTVVFKENILLQEGKAISIEVVAHRKKELVDELNSIQRRTLSKITDQIKSKNKSVLSKISESYRHLNELTRMNTILLNANIEINRKFMEMYKVQNVEKTLDNFGYNKDGINAGARRLEKIMPAISVDNKI